MINTGLCQTSKGIFVVAMAREPVAPNMRDLGGWQARGGQVRRGLVFRSGALTGVQGEQNAVLASRGIRYVYDLRTAPEREVTPDRIPPNVDHVVVDIFRDLGDFGPARLINAMPDPKMVDRLLGAQDTTARFEMTYRSMISLPSAMTGYHRLFSDLADSEHTPAVFHCTTGKDRTGWAAAALLMLLGVDDDDVYADYLMTNQQVLASLQPIIDQFVAAGGDVEALKPILSVQAEYLDTAVDEMRQRFGSIEEYFINGLNLDQATIERLRTNFIDRG
jgi:protein-tyrosine phosphatase